MNFNIFLNIFLCIIFAQSAWFVLRPIWPKFSTMVFVSRAKWFQINWILYIANKIFIKIISVFTRTRMETKKNKINEKSAQPNNKVTVTWTVELTDRAAAAVTANEKTYIVIDQTLKSPSVNWPGLSSRRLTATLTFSLVFIYSYQLRYDFRLSSRLQLHSFVIVSYILT